MGPATVPVVKVLGSLVVLPVAISVLEVAASAVTVGGGGIVGWVAPGGIVVVAAAGGWADWRFLSATIQNTAAIPMPRRMPARMPRRTARRVVMRAIAASPARSRVGPRRHKPSAHRTGPTGTRGATAVAAEQAGVQITGVAAADRHPHGQHPAGA